jgi:two-component system alkaline phosphatase synthesis response regulator PhoP
MAKKIIIIEDENLILELLSKKLSSEGYQVISAVDGEDGLKKIKEERPELILLDIVMPKIGGMEVLEIMNKEKIAKGTPVIIISNSGQPVEIDKAKRLGACDWLVKTEFDPQTVLDKVIKQIGR